MTQINAGVDHARMRPEGVAGEVAHANHPRPMELTSERTLMSAGDEPAGYQKPQLGVTLAGTRKGTHNGSKALRFAQVSKHAKDEVRCCDTQPLPQKNGRGGGGHRRRGE